MTQKIAVSKRSGVGVRRGAGPASSDNDVYSPEFVSSMDKMFTSSFVTKERIWIPRQHSISLWGEGGF